MKLKGIVAVRSSEFVMPPEIEIERLEWKVAEIEAEIGDGPMPLADLINLCVLKHDCMESIARFRALRHNESSSAMSAKTK